jgi:hypothetical protein
MPKHEALTGTLPNEVHLTVDLGTTNSKPSRVDYRGDAVRSTEESWIQNRRGLVTFDGDLGTYSVWTGEVLHQNLDPLTAWLNSANADVKIASGISATALAVSDSKDNTLAVFTNKPVFSPPLNASTMERLQSVGLDPATADHNRLWKKIAAIVDHYPQIGPTLLTSNRLDELYFEPLLSLVVRKARGIPQGEVGFTIDDWRGLTGNGNDPIKATEVLTALGLKPHQYKVQLNESRLLEVNAEKVAIGGDFQVAGWFISELIQESLSGRSLINPEVDIIREFDSNVKDAYYGHDQTTKELFVRPNHYCVYTVERNGASVNPNIIFEMWQDDLASISQENNGWFQWVDDQIGDIAMDSNPYVYVPLSTDLNEFGSIYHKDQSGYKKIDISKTHLLSGVDKRQLTAAIYCGLGCEFQFKYGDAPSLVLYGGFIQPAQPNKLHYFIAGLSPKTRADRLVAPDAGVMTSLLVAKTNMGKDAKVSDVARREHLDQGLRSESYFQNEWLPIRRQLT